MKTELAHEIIDILPRGRTVFSYYKDAYAVRLLRRYLRKYGPQKIVDLRSKKLGRLLSKPMFFQLLQQSGSGIIALEDLDFMCPFKQEYYILTLAVWGHDRAYGWEQVSRKGANLTLQLNFSNQHDQIYKNLVSDDFDAFKYFGHPISLKRNTMAWARIDLDFDRDEALIEEIQTDWMRMVSNCLKHRNAAIRRAQKYFKYSGVEISVEKSKQYFWGMEEHQKTWSEAMLNAAIDFLFDEIGIGKIYYHAYETGAVLKGIDWGRPPKSLYSDLPSKFCFEKVAQGPEFIENDKRARRKLKAIKSPSWFLLSA